MDGLETNYDPSTSDIYDIYRIGNSEITSLPAGNDFATYPFNHHFCYYRHH